MYSTISKIDTRVFIKDGLQCNKSYSIFDNISNLYNPKYKKIFILPFLKSYSTVYGAMGYKMNVDILSDGTFKINLIFLFIKKNIIGINDFLSNTIFLDREAILPGYSDIEMYTVLINATKQSIYTINKTVKYIYLDISFIGLYGKRFRFDDADIYTYTYQVRGYLEITVNGITKKILVPERMKGTATDNVGLVRNNTDIIKIDVNGYVGNIVFNLFFGKVNVSDYGKETNGPHFLGFILNNCYYISYEEVPADGEVMIVATMENI